MFLSHNSADKPQVEALGRALFDVGLRPWLDKWDLRPGSTWLNEIAAAIKAARCVVVCVGAHGIGRVHAPEIDVALNEAFGDEDKHIFALLLPDAPTDVELPAFLGRYTQIDLRGDAVGSVATAAQKIAKWLGHSDGSIPLDEEPPSPFRGLQAYGVEHARWFFGREDETATILAQLRVNAEAGQRMLTVVGASGSGKSSLAMAGLFPAVTSGELDGRYDWRVLMMRPGARPLHELAVQLLKMGGGDVGGDPAERHDVLKRLREQLSDEPSALSDHCDLLSGTGEGQHSEPRVLLVVDQLEELFVSCEDDTERDAFVQAVTTAAQLGSGRVWVVATLRADFLGEALQQHEMRTVLQRSQWLLGPMERAGLERAVQLPALYVGAHFETGLVQTLVDAVSAEPGDLPLLQVALQALWRARERDSRRLTHEAYRQMGGVRGALEAHAEAWWTGLAEEQQTSARPLLTRLVRLGEGGPDTRRRVARTELEALGKPIEQLINALVAERWRLLVVHDDDVEVAHEALIRHWARLRGWVDESRQALRLRDELRKAAERWDKAKRATSEVLRGGLLVQAIELQASGALQLIGTEVAFLVASVRERKRAQQRLWTAIGALATLALIALLAAGYAFQQQRLAKKRLNEALQTANLIYSVADTELAHIGVAAGVRRKLLDAAAKLLDALQGDDANAERERLRARMITHNQRGNLAMTHDDIRASNKRIQCSIGTREAAGGSGPHKRTGQIIPVRQL